MLGKQELTAQWGDGTILTHCTAICALTKALTGTPGTQKWGPDSVEGPTAGGGRADCSSSLPGSGSQGVCGSSTDGPAEAGGKEREGADTATRKAVLRSLGFIPWAVRSKAVKQTALNTQCFLSATRVSRATAQDQVRNLGGFRPPPEQAGPSGQVSWPRGAR